MIPLYAVADRLLRSGDGLLQRIRLLFVALIGLNVITTALVAISTDDVAVTRRAALLGTQIAIAAWAVWYYRGAGRGVIRILLPLGLVAVIGTLGVGRDPFVGALYCVLFLQTLYRHPPSRLALLVAGNLGAAVTAAVSAGNGLAPLLTDTFGLFAVATIMQVIAVVVERHERMAARDSLLTDVTADLLRARRPQEVAQLVADGVHRLVDVPGAMVTVWRLHGAHLQRVAMAGRDEYPVDEIDLASVPDTVAPPEYFVRVTRVTGDALALVEEHFGIDAEFQSLLIGPLVRDGQLTGLLIVASPACLDDDLLPVIQRFTHEVTLAQGLVDRDVLFAGIVENSADLVVTVDRFNTVTYVSPRLMPLSGRAGTTVVGGDLGSLLRTGDGSTPMVAAGFADGPPVPATLVGAGRDVEVEVSVSEVEANGHVLNVRDVSDRRRLEEEIHYRAYFDTLTGLPNRASLLDRLDQVIREADGRPAAVLLVDLDEFKDVNDTLGHGAGDALLIEVGRRLRAVVRADDTVARLAGDEFALVLEDATDAAEAREVAARILATLREPMSLEGRELRVRASVGIAVAAAMHPDEILQNADAAMYAAKAAGKGGIAVFDPQMHQESLRRLRLRERLEAALVRSEFVLYYQPIMSMSDTPSPVGFEALLRWEDPEEGLVSPAEFIPVAEETGIIVAIGRWVLQEACRQLAEWTRAGAAETTLSVNLSSVQLQSDEIVDDVAAALEQSGLDPRRLTLEVTETALVDDVERAAEVLRELKRLGVRLAIDDFGTGYSSFSHLQQFPVDIIKVDQSFVSVVTEGVEQAALATAIVKLAASLRLDTVAEGVELTEQADLLRGWGCDYGQGWLWSPATPAEAAAAMLGLPVA